MAHDPQGVPRTVAPDVADRASAFVTTYLQHASAGVHSPACDDALHTLSRAGAPEVEAATRLLDEALARWGRAVSDASAALTASRTAVDRATTHGLVEALELTDSANDHLMLAMADAGLYLEEVAGRLNRIGAYQDLCNAIATTAEAHSHDLEVRGDPRGSALRAGPVTTARQRHLDLAQAHLVLSQGVAALALGQRSATDLRTHLARTHDLIATAVTGTIAASTVAEVRGALDGAVARCSQVTG